MPFVRRKGKNSIFSNDNRYAKHTYLYKLTCVYSYLYEFDIEKGDYFSKVVFQTQINFLNFSIHTSSPHSGDQTVFYRYAVAAYHSE